MSLFFATTVNKLDAKGRVSVPAGFRDVLAAQTYKGVILLKSPKAECLEGFAHSFMETMSARMDHFDLFSDTQDDIAMSVFGQAVALQFDGDGRITLPTALRDYAGIGSEVAFVGLGQKFQIWSPERLAVRQQAAVATFQQRGLTIPARTPVEGKD
ncbi:MAG: division/cell wall cluster transcriptional repressor MraZ [Pseudomonadota bacterium]